MHIESLSIRNFRCFGDTPVKIPMQPGITCFIGDNGAGKTSALEALKRLFSPESSERQLRKSDVHFKPEEDFKLRGDFKLEEESQSEFKREVVIDVVFGFADQKNIPLVFNDVHFNADDQSLKVRLVFEGRYIKSESYEDDIDVELYIVRTLDDVPFGPDDERKIPFRRRPASFVELVYIPAHRDSLGVTRRALKKLLRRIERSADWNDQTRTQSQEFAEALEKNLHSVPAIETVVQDLENYWTGLHEGHYDMKPVVSVVATEFEQLIRDLTLRFEKAPGGGQRQLEELSEGQVSLLYFALSATLHNLIWKMQAQGASGLEGFRSLDFEPAPLTIFALEEPENHLAPFYLPRLVGFLEKLIEEGSAQSIMTSHSTSILTRIAPRNVRYFQNDRSSLISSVKKMSLPDEESEEDKFLHQVILANPEIYFARLVIIGEGHSERIVIPRIAKALGIEIDPSFVAFIPIGGRHAKQLWHVLKELSIDCVTLLDFDLGRHNGGMGRIKNAIHWLSEAGMDHARDLEPVPSNDETTTEIVKEYLERLERDFKVFYSYPLDLDMMMLQAYPNAYVPIRPYNPSTDDEERDKIKTSVFGEKGVGNDDLEHVREKFSNEELFRYHNLFRSRSKPSSHYQALASLDKQTLRDSCPKTLRTLIDAVAISLRTGAK